MLFTKDTCRYIFESNDIEIYNKMINMQYEFNVSIGKDHKTQQFKTYIEVYNLLQALSDEVVESKNCFNWKWWSKEGKEYPLFTHIIDLQNYHIELIDMLHFILSLNILVPTEINSFMLTNVYLNTLSVNSIDTIKNNISFRYFILESLLSEIQSIKYYLISNDLIDIPNQNVYYLNDKFLFKNLNHLVKICWNILGTLLIHCDNLTFEDIYKMYSLKMETNKTRQKNNYSVKDKTEDDNKNLYKDFLMIEKE